MLWILALVLASIVFTILELNRKNRSYGRIGWHGGIAWVTGLLAIISISFLFIQYPCSIGSIAKMEAFREATLISYTNIVVESKNLPARGSQTKFYDIVVDLSTLGQNPKVIDVMSKLGDDIKQYNNDLAEYRAYNNFWFTDPFNAEVPEEWGYLVFNLNGTK